MTQAAGPAPAPQAALTCSQCGGILQPAEGQIFLTCPFCSSTVFLDKSRVVFHWSLACTIKPEDAQAALRRWMAGNQTVKDLDRKATIVSQDFAFFPLWYFRAGAAGGETVYLEPAAAIEVRELKQLPLPPGDLIKYNPDLDSQARMPDVSLAAVTQRLAAAGMAEGDVHERALVHVPLYTFKYTLGKETYTALVDGAAGRVFAGIYPAKWEAPYLTIAGVSALLYFLISWIPTISNMGGGAALGAGLTLYAVAAALLAVPIFLVALWIAAKV